MYHKSVVHHGLVEFGVGWIDKSFGVKPGTVGSHFFESVSGSGTSGFGVGLVYAGEAASLGSAAGRFIPRPRPRLPLGHHAPLDLLAPLVKFMCVYDNVLEQTIRKNVVNSL